MDAWLKQLKLYLDQLEATAGELQATIDTTRKLTRDGAFATLPEANASLQAGLTAMEQLLEQRRGLLDELPSPDQCYSLRDALRVVAGQSSHRAVAQALQSRCERIERQIDGVREDSLSLFVCHYHLADTATHFLQLLFPDRLRSETYDRETRIGQGGGLLDKSA